MPERTILAELLADPTSKAPAIIDCASTLTISYRDLAQQIERLAGQLAAAGLSPGQRVSIVLPNGLEFLVVFLAVARAGLVAAPLNPAYKLDELLFFIEDAQARAIVGPRNNSALVEAAQRLEVPLWPTRIDPAGQVQIDELGGKRPVDRPAPNPTDMVLFLHTSGTTSRPKGVPLTHANVMRSINNIAAHYGLSPADRSLVVMPLFHVHGLIGATFSSLAAGGAVIVPPRFSAQQFWNLAQTYEATWYSAVPTIHQVLLLRAESDGAPAHSGFRFIRSCSSALAASTLAQLEARFAAPVLEAYGMTEAAHQVASNPLPPAVHKPGTVGVGGRVEVAIMDEAGNLLRSGEAGEVVIKGANVTSGYWNNPEANSTAFTNGWFRTGDRGTIDPQGYVTLIGRIKELINRGGEKISPLEIDAVLLEHPAVAEAASFGSPSELYGEEVAAAVVLKGEASAQELQNHCRGRLAEFKVPKTIYIVEALPKGPTGKVQRREMAAFVKR
ncbi:MAG TPA: acyl--CoA ligase [Candidatus Binataceae bacterium]|nr:acyl--CoA ligase [Candidatus Binataceae bacterium]